MELSLIDFTFIGWPNDDAMVHFFPTLISLGCSSKAFAVPFFFFDETHISSSLVIVCVLLLFYDRETTSLDTRKKQHGWQMSVVELGK